MYTRIFKYQKKSVFTRVSCCFSIAANGFQSGSHKHLLVKLNGLFLVFFHSQTSCQTTSSLLLIFAFFYGYTYDFFLSHISHIYLPFINIFPSFCCSFKASAGS